MAAPYPAEWEADVVLSDGSTAHVRPILPADADRLRAFHARLSPQTVYFRYFAPYPVLTARDVEHLTTVDHTDRVALVATVRDEMAAVARYDRLPEVAGEPAQAEVAFVVRDDYQGRGLGSVLLEHLAAAARERGVRHFVAHVLPSNARMVRVFRDAGYQTTSSLVDGDLELGLALEPTLASSAVMTAREHRAEARSVHWLLSPRAVAVIGGSRRPESVGNALVRHLLAAGFAGQVHVVNPAAHAAGETVEGLAPAATVTDLPPPVDLAVVVVPAPSVPDVVDECARAGVHGLVVVSSGFADAGPEGRARQHDLVARARAGGMRLIGPNCLGVINTAPDVRLNASLAPDVPDPGRIGFFSQSGAFGAALLERLAGHGLGLSTFVSAGNRADVSGNDLIQYWEDDTATDVLLLYLESIGNPRKFSRLARRTSQTKPIVAVKSGRASQAAPLGHAVGTSRVPPEAVDALFAQSGVIQVDTLPEMFDIATLLAAEPLPAGRRVGVLGNADALGVLAAAACVEAGLRVARGPVTLPAGATPAEFGAELADHLADGSIDAALCLYLAPGESSYASLVEALAAVSAGTGKPVLVVHGLGVTSARLMRTEHGDVAAYPSVENAVRSLASVSRYVEWRNGPHDLAPELDDIDADTAHNLVAAELRTMAGGDGVLDPPAAAALLGCYGIPVWPARSVRSPDEAVAAADELGYPVVLKSTAPALAHRADLGGVRLELGDEAAVRRAYAGLVTAFGPRVALGLVVQRMAGGGVPCRMTTTEDPLFGPIVSFGVGGVVASLVGDVVYGIPPLSRHDVAALVRAPRAAPLLLGHRGAEPTDLAGLEDLLLRLGRLADDLPEVAELELDPVLSTTKGAAVLSARVRVATGAVRRDGPTRRLW